MSANHEKVLVIGFGNPGRGDDGLGPAFAEAVEKLEIPGVAVEADYQLNVEDAAAAAENHVVLFVDADAVGPEPYSFKEIEPKPAFSFSSHSTEPEAVLALAHELFDSSVKGYLLGIHGYHFDEFSESFTKKAEINLALALQVFERVLHERSFDKMASPQIAPPGREEPCRTANT